MISAIALLLAPLPLAPPPQDGINCWAAYAPQMPGSTRGGIAGEARIAVITAVRAALTEQPVAAKPDARPYVVRGDEVVIGAAQGGFVPAIHPKSGISGCLPLSALRVLPLPPAPRLTDWRGNWSQTSKRSMKSLAIVLHGSMLAIKGDASVQHGAKDNYDFGEFDDEGRPSGASLITDADGPCRTRFQLLGRYLVVSDVIVVDDDCPNYGMGVGFSGVYTRDGN